MLVSYTPSMSHLIHKKPLILYLPAHLIIGQADGEDCYALPVGGGRRETLYALY